MLSRHRLKSGPSRLPSPAADITHLERYVTSVKIVLSLFTRVSLCLSPTRVPSDTTVCFSTLSLLTSLLVNYRRMSWSVGCTSRSRCRRGLVLAVQPPVQGSHGRMLADIASLLNTIVSRNLYVCNLHCKKSQYIVCSIVLSSGFRVGLHLPRECFNLCYSCNL